MNLKESKKFKLALYALTVCTVLGFSSCGDGDDPAPKAEYTLTLTPASSDEVAFNGGEVEVAVAVADKATGAKASIGWAVSSSEEWATFDPQRGTGDGEFKVTAAANPNEAARNATVTVTLADGLGEATVTVKQQAKQINWTFTRKGKFSDFCVGLFSPWTDWGDYGAGLYHKCELGADGWLTLKTNYRLHYYILESEPGYVKFISVDDQQYAAAPEVNIAAGKTDFSQCGLFDNSPKYLTKPDSSVGNGDGELWDHGRGKTAAEYKFHLKAGTYWLVCLRAGMAESDKAEFGDVGQYPVDVAVDEVISFEKD